MNRTTKELYKKIDSLAYSTYETSVNSHYGIDIRREYDGLSTRPKKGGVFWVNQMQSYLEHCVGRWVYSVSKNTSRTDAKQWEILCEFTQELTDIITLLRIKRFGHK